MATIPSTTPLLAHPKANTSNARGLVVFLLAIAAIISLTAFLPRQLTTNTPLDPTYLCSTSPNPTACRATVSDSLLTPDANSHSTSPLHVVQSIIASSLRHLDAAEGVLQSPSSSTPAVADCIHLLDLSRDRLLASAAAAADGASSDTQTFLSAVMTFHDTCLDGLHESASEPDIEAHVMALREMSSAALAVVSTVTRNNPDDHQQLFPRAFLNRFPSWLAEEDRRLLDEEPGKIAAAADSVVAKDGSGKFTTVQAALDAAPSNSASRYVIYVKKGTYKETVKVAKKQTNVMIMGDGIGATVITGSLNVVDGSTTFNSATLASDADGLILQDLTVQNTAGAVKHQAVALRVSGDKSVINRCRLEAYQDTLYNHALRQFFRDSYVSGTVDFIFGNAAVVFQKCNLVVRKPMSGQKNAVTAQGRTDPNQNTGTSVQDCRVTADSDLAPVTSSFPSYLGRPWKVYSRTVFMQSYLDSLINPAGWLEWDGTTGLDTLYYGEYANTGPGAGTSKRVNWKGYHVITQSSDAVPFTVDKLIQGSSWLPATGVTFKAGL